MPLTNHRFNHGEFNIGYKLYVPVEYEQVKDRSFPLFLFLHGVKKRGDDLSLLDNYGLLRVVEQKKDFPYIVVAPQCPADKYWPDIRMTIIELIDEVTRNYRVDLSRMYLTGFSMGAYGVWDLAAKTDRFAAAIPISGWYDSSEAINLTSIPIWAFHGEVDNTVLIRGSESMINAIQKEGGHPKFTRYPELDHSHTVMYETYKNPDLYIWLENKKNVKS